MLKNWLTGESSLVARDGALQLSRSVFEGVMNNSLTIELVPDKTPLERYVDLPSTTVRYRTRSKGGEMLKHTGQTARKRSVAGFFFNLDALRGLF